MATKKPQNDPEDNAAPVGRGLWNAAHVETPEQIETRRALEAALASKNDTQRESVITPTSTDRPQTNRPAQIAGVGLAIALVGIIAVIGITNLSPAPRDAQSAEPVAVPTSSASPTSIPSSEPVESDVSFGLPEHCPIDAFRAAFPESDEQLLFENRTETKLECAIGYPSTDTSWWVEINAMSADEWNRQKLDLQAQGAEQTNFGLGEIEGYTTQIQSELGPYDESVIYVDGFSLMTTAIPEVLIPFLGAMKTG
jgi:hypothetical protein